MITTPERSAHRCSRRRNGSRAPARPLAHPTARGPAARSPDRTVTRIQERRVGLSRADARSQLAPSGLALPYGRRRPHPWKGGAVVPVSLAAPFRPTQQRAGAPSGAPGLLLCQEAGVSPCAPGRRPFREQARAEAERCCSRNARAFSTGSAGVSGCSRPGVDVGRAAASCDREVLDEVVAGRGASIMGVAAADGHSARGGWAGGARTRSCTR
jgi:hypothetical protein